MILSESTVASDISKKLKNDFSLIKQESIIKRIKRFFTNKLFDAYDFYNNIIIHVISTYKKKHDDKRVHIVFDHMFSHDNYTVFMLTMRIGNQGIPLWFRCFKGKNSTEAFDEELLKQGIEYVSNLFGDSYNLIFLADRWFNSTTLLQYIEGLGHTYVVRLKRNLKVKINSSLNNKNVKTIGDIKAYANKAKHFNNAILTDNEFKTNIAISKKVLKNHG